MPMDPENRSFPVIRHGRRRRCLSDSLLEAIEAREQGDWDLEVEDFDDIVRQIRTGRLGIADPEAS